MNLPIRVLKVENLHKRVRFGIATVPGKIFGTFNETPAIYERYESHFIQNGTYLDSSESNISSRSANEGVEKVPCN